MRKIRKENLSTQVLRQVNQQLMVLRKKIESSVEKDFRDGITRDREKTSKKYYLYRDQVQALKQAEESQSQVLREILDKHLEESGENE